MGSGRLIVDRPLPPVQVHNAAGINGPPGPFYLLLGSSCTLRCNLLGLHHVSDQSSGTLQNAGGGLRPSKKFIAPQYQIKFEHAYFYFYWSSLRPAQSDISLQIQLSFRHNEVFVIDTTIIGLLFMLTITIQSIQAGRYFHAATFVHKNIQVRNPFQGRLLKAN